MPPVGIQAGQKIGLPGHKKQSHHGPGRTGRMPLGGTVGMNESWRFIPKNGTTLYQSVELLTASGTSIATGDTTRIDSSYIRNHFSEYMPPRQFFVCDQNNV